MQPQSELDLVFAFYQELCRQLETVIPFRKAAGGGIDVEGWLNDIDAAIDVHQVRVHVQTHATSLDVLRAVLKRLIAKPSRSDSENSKIDLLLVQYLAQAISGDPTELSLPQSAAMLEPVLGVVAPNRLAVVGELLHELRQFSRVRDLVNANTLEKAQQIRATSHDHTAASLVTFTWLGLLLRHGCVRLLISDLQSIESDLTQLIAFGVRCLDARELGLAEQEPLENLQRKCREWRKPFPGKYQNDIWFRQIACLHDLTQAAVMLAKRRHEEAIAAAAAATPKVEAPQPKATVAAAPALSVKSSVSTPEKPASSTPEKPAAVAAAVNPLRPLTPATAAPATPDVSKDEPSRESQRKKENIKRTATVEDYIAAIMAGLKSLRSGSAARVRVGKAGILLSPDEIHAFRSPDTPVSQMLKQAAAVRALLADAMENSNSAQLKEARQRAATELELIRRAASEAEKAKKVDLAINLTASARALEKIMAKSQ